MSRTRSRNPAHRRARSCSRRSRPRGGDAAAGAWTSAPGAGILVTLLERPRDAEGDRVALVARGTQVGARARPIRRRRRCSSSGRTISTSAARSSPAILVEARWRDEKLEWVAIGIGINLRAPRALPAASLRSGTSRVEVLAELIPALRAAAAATGPLSARGTRRFRGARSRPRAAVHRTRGGRGGGHRCERRIARHQRGRHHGVPQRIARLRGGTA